MTALASMTGFQIKIVLVVVVEHNVLPNYRNHPTYLGIQYFLWKMCLLGNVRGGNYKVELI